jgi:hypothetical protein
MPLSEEPNPFEAYRPGYLGQSTRGVKEDIHCTSEGALREDAAYVEEVSGFRLFILSLTSTPNAELYPPATRG